MKLILYLKAIIVYITLFISLLFADINAVTKSANIVIDVLESQENVRHLTPYLIEISRNGHNLDAGTKDKLKSLDFDFSGPKVLLRQTTLLDQIYDTSHFRLHFTLDGIDAVNSTDSDADNIPDYIETMAEVFEDVYNHEINILGYTAPPSDAGAGGSNNYDIYVENSNAYGFTNYLNFIGDNPKSSENENNAWTSYIEMRNNYNGFDHTELENIQVTAGHEFFHAIQLGYDGDEKVWLLEASATWMEEETYDQVNDVYQYMVPWFSEPQVNLKNIFNLHMYGSYIFFKYIDEHLGGEDVIRRMWRYSRQYNSSDSDYSIKIIDEALQDFGYTFKIALNNMSIANRIFSNELAAGSYSYEEAIGYKNYFNYSLFDTLSIELAIQDSLNFIKGETKSIESNNLQEYGAQYFNISTTDPINISLKKPVSDSDPLEDLAMHVIVKSTSGNYQIRNGRTINIDPTINTDWISVVIVADDDNSTDYNYILTFSDGVRETGSSFSITNQFPNPFSSSTTINLEILDPQNIVVNIYDSLGRQVRNLYSGNLSTGSHSLVWNGKSKNGKRAGSGIYYVRVSGQNQEILKKITLIK